MPNLYEIESDLQALVDSADTVTEEQVEEYRLALQSALETSIAKRQRVGEFLRHCEVHEDACDQEINRLKALKAQYSKARERVEDFVIRTVLTIGRDDKGDLKVLEGQTVKLAVKSTPEAVVIDDDATIPAAYQNVTVKMPATTWELICAVLPDNVLNTAGYECKEERTPNKSSIRAAIKSKTEVPGCRLQGGYRLEVK